MTFFVTPDQVLFDHFTVILGKIARSSQNLLGNGLLVWLPGFASIAHQILKLLYTTIDRWIVVFAGKVTSVHRIVPHIPIEVHLILVSDRIGLHEPAERGRVHAGFVVVHAELGEPSLTGVLEPSAVGRAGLPIFVIGVDRR